MSKRSKACIFSANERQKVYNRDNYMCIFCGSSNWLELAHFISRAQGGLGIAENGAMACKWCHMAYDGVKRAEYKKIFEKYLKTKYENWSKERLVYSKWR